LHYTIRDAPPEEEVKTTFGQVLEIIQNMFSLIVAIAAIVGMYVAHKHTKKAPPVKVSDPEHDIVSLLKRSGGMKPTEIQDQLSISVDELTTALKSLLRKNVIYIQGTTIHLKHDFENHES